MSALQIQVALPTVHAFKVSLIILTLWFQARKAIIINRLAVFEPLPLCYIGLFYESTSQLIVQRYFLNTVDIRWMPLVKKVAVAMLGENNAVVSYYFNTWRKLKICIKLISLKMRLFFRSDLPKLKPLILNLDSRWWWRWCAAMRGKFNETY